MRQTRSHPRRLQARPWRERGVAVITALLLTTLAISIVASLFWQQQVQVRSMENQRLHLQTRWILRGALDYASLVLNSRQYDQLGSQMTSLDQPWATPLADTRLDQYIERERVEGEHFDATLSGKITDACSRYNLRNLAVEFRNVNGDQVEVFRRLLVNLQMDPSLALRVASMVAVSLPAQAVPDNISNNTGNTGNTTNTGNTGNTGAGASAGGTNGAAGGSSGGSGSTVVPASGVSGVPMKLLQVDDLLAVPGFTPALIERLRPFVIVLPEVTKLNVNTAAPEVLAAVANVSMSAANSLVYERKQAALKSYPAFEEKVRSQTNGMAPNSADVKSEWFLVDSHIRLDRAALDAEALVYSPLTLVSGDSGGPVVKWVRQY